VLEVRNEEIWLPDGSLRNVREMQAARAVEEYDPALRLGQMADNGEWVVLKNVRGNVQPVLGLGFELPSPEKVKERLYKSDVRRHGARLALDVEKRNQARIDAVKAEGREASRETAERLLHAARKLGSMPRQTFVPADIPKKD
jgi:hypothetical protein